MNNVLLNDQGARRIAKIAVLIVIGLGLFLALIQLTCRTPADSHAIIDGSSIYKEHDSFCLGLPRPPDFDLKYKTVGGNGNTIAISYIFGSSLRYADVKDFFGTKLRENGWTGTEATFTKDHYRLVVDIDIAVSEPNDTRFIVPRKFYRKPS